jgi:hypothetical protein
MMGSLGFVMWATVVLWHLHAAWAGLRSDKTNFVLPMLFAAVFRK